MPGIAAQGVGLEALARLAPPLASLNREIPIELVIVTSDYARAMESVSAFPFPAVFRQWRLLSFLDHVENADVCVLPHPETAYALSKSANRALASLNVGTPVVADFSRAYLPLSEAMVLGNWELGLRRYLTNDVAMQSDISKAHSIISRLFSLEVVGDAWGAAVTEAIARR
jgi:hypothetical protein